MAFQGPPCSSCGGRELVRRPAGFACAFCGARTIPRLEPGTLCADARSGFCSSPAESLCKACGRPLCDRHNDPRRLYWHARLDWRLLCAEWTTQDRAQWARLNGPLSGFPAPGVEPPFEWVSHERDSRRAIGRLEDSVLEAVRPLALRWGGDTTEMGCVFDGVCAECVAEADREIAKTVKTFGTSYRQVALRERIAALRAECEQALRYVETVLGRPAATTIRDEDQLPPLGTLDASSPRRDWDRWAIRIRERLAAIDRFAPRAAVCGRAGDGGLA